MGAQPQNRRIRPGGALGVDARHRAFAGHVHIFYTLCQRRRLFPRVDSGAFGGDDNRLAVGLRIYDRGAGNCVGRRLLAGYHLEKD